MDRLKKRLLLVEDDIDIAEALTTLLEAEDYVVFHVRDGQSALDIIDHNPHKFHMAIIDLIIPGPKGDEIAKEFRNRSLMTPTLIMSGAGPQWLKEHDLNQGDAFIKKPMNIDHLYDLVHKLSNKHKSLKGAA